MKRNWKTTWMVLISATLAMLGTVLWGAERGSPKFSNNNNNNGGNSTRNFTPHIQQIQHQQPAKGPQFGNGQGSNPGQVLQGQIHNNQNHNNAKPMIGNGSGIQLPGNFGQNGGIKIPLPGNGNGNNNGNNNGPGNGSGGIVVKPFPFPNNNGNHNGQGNGNANHHHHGPVVCPDHCYHPPVKYVPQIVVVQLPAVIVAETPLTQIPVGSQLDLKGVAFGNDVGRALLQIGDVILPAEIKFWSNEQVTLVLPPMGLMQSTKGAIHVVRADGQPAYSLPCQLVVPQK